MSTKKKNPADTDLKMIGLWTDPISSKRLFFVSCSSVMIIKSTNLTVWLKKKGYCGHVLGNRIFAAV